MTKAELRRIYLERQKNLSPAERAGKSARIAERFFAEFDVEGIKFLHCFLPIEKFAEINTNLILRKIWRDFSRVQTFAPRVNFQSNEIENAMIAPAAKLVKNVWEISEPTETTTIKASKIDLVLVPLICFDFRGFRVGYGKGFYDRFLKQCRADCLKIGLSYFAPVAEISDAGDFDVNLSFCVTPTKVWQF